MKKWYLACSVLGALSLGASERSGNNNNLFGKSLYTFHTKQLAKQAETGSYAFIIKCASDKKRQEGSVNSQLQQAFSYAVDQNNPLAAWNLSRAYYKQQEDLKYNVKSWAWGVAGVAAGAATMWACHYFIPHSNTSNKKSD